MTESAFAVRRATKSDAVMLHLIAAATFPLACEGAAPRDMQQHIDEYLSVERFRAYAQDESRRLLVVEVGGTPAGYAMLTLDRTTRADILALTSSTDTVELVSFYLLAGRHGTGLADALMAEVLVEATASGAGSVWLGVGNHNSRANSFYDRYTFERRGTTPFTVGSVVLDDLIRERAL